MPRKAISCFVRDQSGAVTVDWVVLTALVVALAIAFNILYQSILGDRPADVADALELHGQTVLGGPNN